MPQRERRKEGYKQCLNERVGSLRETGRDRKRQLLFLKFCLLSMRQQQRERERGVDGYKQCPKERGARSCLRSALRR